MTDLKKELDYYIAHQDELVEKHNGRVVVIKDCQVIGVYNNDIEAITETSKTHELGTFMVQRVGPGADNYTHTFHSRVAFV